MRIVNTRYVIVFMSTGDILNIQRHPCVSVSIFKITPFPVLTVRKYVYVYDDRPRNGGMAFESENNFQR